MDLGLVDWLTTFLLLLASCLTLTVSTKNRGGLDDKNKVKAYACLASESTISIKCDSNEKIVIYGVFYGGQPAGCGDWIDENNCLQYSEIVTESVRKACDGKPECEAKVVPISRLQDEDILPVQNSCGVGDGFFDLINTNFMRVEYVCQEFEFCKEIVNKTVGDLTIQTPDYPQTIVTNPNCKCTFSGPDSITFIKAYVECNGTVVFRTQEKTPKSDSSNGEFEMVEQTYYCSNNTYPNAIPLGGGNCAAITISVDVANSSEYSSYSMKFVTTIPKLQGGVYIRARKEYSVITVNCDAGGLYLTYTIKLVIIITVSVGLAAIIALIVLYCIIKRRRNKAKKWRRKNIRLPAQGEKGTSLLSQKPRSPTASIVSTPSSTRRKPDGQFDSGSDDDLAEYASKLHKQNTQRKQEELAKRQLYYQDDYIPRLNTPSQPLSTMGDYYDRERPHLYMEKRCRSSSNIATKRLDSPDERVVAQRLLRGTKSVSNSRTSLRSMKRRAPQPPGPTVSRSNSQKSQISTRTELVYVPGHYEERPTFNDEDPDLTFDDPRARSDRNREYTPTRTPIRSRSNTAERRPIRSRSNTADRSDKRPRNGHSGSERPTDLMLPSRGTTRSRANTAERPSPLAQDNNLASSHPDKPHTRKKPGYFNPYAVKVPEKQSSSKPSKFQSREKDVEKGSIDVQPSVPYNFNRQRNYSDEDSPDDHSDHDLEDIQQVGVLGDLDMGDVAGVEDITMNDDSMY